MTSSQLSAISHELRFWARFVHTVQFKSWLQPGITPELAQGQPAVADFLQKLPPCQILDVGSGVASILTGLHHNITTVDPLGELYELIFDYDRRKIKPPIPIPAEELSYKNAFDVVHMRNALDHSQDPHRVILNLVDACAIGGHVIIHGFENEADAENRQGFHQTNLSIMEGTLALNNWKIDFPTIQVIKAEVSKLSTGKNWITWIARKI